MTQTLPRPPTDAPPARSDAVAPAQPQPPPGWYPNPDGSASQRWWSGTAWTDAVSTNPYPPSPTGPAAPYVLQARTNGLAIASLVCALAGMFTLGAAGIPAVFLGHHARAQIRRSNGAETGDGLALAGIIVGYFMIAFLVLVVLLLSIGASQPT